MFVGCWLKTKERTYVHTYDARSPCGYWWQQRKKERIFEMKTHGNSPPPRQDDGNRLELVFADEKTKTV
jgi:hypothetical protein